MRIIFSEWVLNTSPLYENASGFFTPKNIPGVELLQAEINNRGNTLMGLLLACLKYTH